MPESRIPISRLRMQISSARDEDEALTGSSIGRGIPQPSNEWPGRNGGPQELEWGSIGKWISRTMRIADKAATSKRRSKVEPSARFISRFPRGETAGKRTMAH